MGNFKSFKFAEIFCKRQTAHLFIGLLWTKVKGGSEQFKERGKTKENNNNNNTHLDIGWLWAKAKGGQWTIQRVPVNNSERGVKPRNQRQQQQQQQHPPWHWVALSKGHLRNCLEPYPSTIYDKQNMFQIIMVFFCNEEERRDKTFEPVASSPHH